MNKFKLALFILIGIFIACVSYNYTIASNTQVLIVQTISVEQLVQRDDWTNAQLQMKQLEQSFNINRKRLNALIDHCELDTLQVAIAKMSSFLHSQEQSDFLAESSAFKMQLEHLPKKDHVTWENIF
ncbi:MAG: DUF4363 family protein [Hyphomonadaceae bacterium]|nr:DUF4363 family protein [Clostridia bacterium]